jgi:beta-glucuronidase
MPADADLIDWVSEYGKPLIMSEFDGDALFGYHGDVLTRWTEEYQENLYEHQIVMLKRISFLRGMTPGILKDFRSPRRTLPQMEDYFNRKGLVSGQGEKKKPSLYFRSFIGNCRLLSHQNSQSPSFTEPFVSRSLTNSR